MPISDKFFVLFEHATGLALIRVDAQEEVGSVLPQVEKSFLDFSLFNTMVKLVAFDPFGDQIEALTTMTSLGDGEINEKLERFLQKNMSDSEAVLGVYDAPLAGEIKKKLGLNARSAQHDQLVAEVLRGCKVHFHKLIPVLTPENESQSFLGLGHIYSRTKVKLNVHRNDNMVIQSIALSDQLDKDINTYSMRVKEWYGNHFPELVKVESDNLKYCKLVELIGNRKKMEEIEDLSEKIEEICQDSDKAAAILKIAKSTIGMDISDFDLQACGEFTRRVISITEYKQSLTEYLHKRMSSVAPNLSALIGDVVGARLISHAGSLTNLAKYPASTVQILGAEKALFRALKKRGNTPKYGLIFHSTFIGKAGQKNKGRISRFLANKASMASRIDCFSNDDNVRSAVFGEKLKEQVEERLKFYEDGTKPRKNTEVMDDACEAYNKLVAEVKVEKKEVKQEVKVENTTNGETPKKKKKKKKSLMKEEVKEEVKVEEVVEETPKKKKKKKKSVAAEEVVTNRSRGGGQIRKEKEEKVTCRKRGNPKKEEEKS